jgi:hypothetical protein
MPPHKSHTSAHFPIIIRMPAHKPWRPALLTPNKYIWGFIIGMVSCTMTTYITAAFLDRHLDSLLHASPQIYPSARLTIVNYPPLGLTTNIYNKQQTYSWCPASHTTNIYISAAWFPHDKATPKSTYTRQSEHARQSAYVHTKCTYKQQSASLLTPPPQPISVGAIVGMPESPPPLGSSHPPSEASKSHPHTTGPNRPLHKKKNKKKTLYRTKAVFCR